MNKQKHRLTLTACLLGLALIGISLFSVTTNLKPTAQITNQGTELLDASWDSMPGTTYTAADGLAIRYQNRQVRTLEDTYVDNPAVMLYGKHIESRGDISLSYNITKRAGSASVLLYSRPPFIMDEQIFRYPMLEVTISDQSYRVQAWNDNTAAPVYDTTIPQGSAASSILTITRSGTSVSVRLDAGTDTKLPVQNLFNGPELWLGTRSTTTNGTWHLASVVAKTIGSATATIIDTRDYTYKRSAGGLQDVAASQRSNFHVGAAVSLMPAMADRAYAQDVFGGDFGMITTENALKMQFVQPQKGDYDFAEADALVTLAQKNTMRVHGHALVFGEANPAWLQTVAPANVEAVMLDHVTKTVEHFKDSIFSWDVINEPLADYDAFTASQPLRNHIWYRSIGASYIEKALRAAHAANPKADLWINDFGMEGSQSDTDDERWQAMLKLVTDLHARGVPLSGVGFQSHVYEAGDEINGAVFASRIEQLAKIGLKARVSELDVHNDNGRAAQANQFNTVAATCFRHANCDSVTTWGVNDAYGSTGYIEDTEFYPGDGLLWDAKNVRLAAYDSIKAALKDAGTAFNVAPAPPAATPQPSLAPSPAPTTPLPTVIPVEPLAPTPTPASTPIPTTAPSTKPTPRQSSLTPTETSWQPTTPPTPTPSPLTMTPVADSSESSERKPEGLRSWWQERYRAHWWRKLLRSFGWRRS